MTENVRSVKDHPYYLLGRQVLLETLRRKDFYVLLILSLLYVMGIIMVNIVGIENASTATFLLNLGMSLGCYFAHILTLLSASRQITDDLEKRTIYPILAKPLRRRDYFMGKWLAVTLSGSATLLIFLFLGWAPVPRLQSFHTMLLLQGIVLLILSLGMTAAMALFFSLIMPKGANLVISALVIFTGSKVINFIQARAADHPLSGMVRWLSGYIPDFGKMNLISRYTDGIAALDPGVFAGLILYAAIITAAFLTMGAILFEKRSL